MTQRTAKQERAEAILGELTELGLLLARDLVEHARGCEDGVEKAALTAAFHKTSRMVRLNLALDAKLDRDAARDDREAAREAQADAEAAERRENSVVRTFADPTPAERQKRRVRNLMNRLLWTESEGDQEEYDILENDLDARLDEMARAPAFADMPIEAIVQRLADDMRLHGEFVITAAETAPAAHAPSPALADTG